jgi:translation initiation factor IF-3
LKLADISDKMRPETNNRVLRSISISKPVRINGAIRANELRVIGPDGSQIGILTRAEALLEAERQKLDLVEISPSANPPVARIVDWGKYNYQKTKELQRNRKNVKTSEVKQMRLGLKIGANDLEIKLRKIRSFLEDGHKVKIMVFFRGREMAHQELGYELIERIAQSLSDVAVVDQKPQLAGKNLSIVVRSNNNAKAKNPQGDSEARQSDR